MERLAEMDTDGIPTYLYRDRSGRLWLVWDDDEALTVTQDKLADFMMEHGLCFTDLGFDSLFKLGACDSDGVAERRGTCLEGAFFREDRDDLLTDVVTWGA